MNKRNKKIDFIKGLCIFLVVWGHVIQYFTPVEYNYFESTVFRIIYSFHMPLFMAISGYLSFGALYRDYKQVLVKRCVALGIPMISWGIISFVCWGHNLINDGIQQVIKGLVAQTIGIWFLTSVLLNFLLCTLTYRLFCWNRATALFFGMLGIGFMWILPQRDLLLFMLPFYIMGITYNHYKDSMKIDMAHITKRTVFIMLVLTIAFICMVIKFHQNYFIYNTGMNPFEGIMPFKDHMYIIVYRYILGAIGVVIVVCSVNWIYPLISSLKIVRCIENIGTKTLEIYLVQRIFIEYIANSVVKAIREEYGLFRAYTNVLVFDVIFAPLISIVFIIIIDQIIAIINKSKKLKFVLFGKV